MTKFCFDVSLQHAVNKFKCIDCSLTDIKSLEHRSSIFRYVFFPVSGSLNFIYCLGRTESVSLVWVLNKIWDEVCIAICDGESH